MIEGPHCIRASECRHSHVFERIVREVAVPILSLVMRPGVD